MRLQTTPIASSSNATMLGWGAGLLGSSITVRFLTPWYSDQLAEVRETELLVPRQGTLKNLHVRHNVPDGNGQLITYTIRVNGSDTALSVILASTASEAMNLVDTIAVNAGDQISIKVDKVADVLRSPRNIVATAVLL